MANSDVSGTPGAGFRRTLSTPLGKPSSDLMGGLRLSQLTNNRSLPRSIFDSNPVPFIANRVNSATRVNKVKVTGYRTIGKVLNRLDKIGR